MDEDRVHEIVRSAMTNYIEVADRESLISRISAIESSYARREDVAELETRIVKWIITTALASAAVAAATAAGVVSFVLLVVE